MDTDWSTNPSKPEDRTMIDLYEPTEEERLVALELLSSALILFRNDRYGGSESMTRLGLLANTLHNVPTFLMGRMTKEEAQEHLDYLDMEIPERMAGARYMLEQYPPIAEIHKEADHAPSNR